jgi:hypothetical protein
MDARKVTLEELRSLQFAAEEVLNTLKKNLSANTNSKQLWR